MIRFVVATALTAVLVASVATLDHRHKRHVEFAEQESAWFCAHGRPSSCTDFDEAAYEERWENRELGYRLSFLTLGALGLGALVVVVVKRSRRPEI